MDVVHPRCCGWDIHKDAVVACVLVSPAGGRPAKVVRPFGTPTAQGLALADWLATHEVPDVALESTGVDWKPVWNVREGSVALHLVNAHHVKQVPERRGQPAAADP